MIRSFSDVLAALNFRLWRWWFTRYKLPQLGKISLKKLKSEYADYKKSGGTMTFESWCGTKV